VSSLARVLAGLALLAAPGCMAAHTVGPRPLGEALGWLREGETTRAEIVAQLGEPGFRFEDGRLETWALGEASAPAKAGPFAPAASLVIVFDEGLRVQRASLVQLW